MQLVHIKQETSWRDHGFVRLKSALGEIIAECSDFQQNRFLGDSWERTVTLVKQALAAHPTKPPKQCDMKDKLQEKMPLSLRAKPDLTRQGNSSMHTVSVRRQAERIRDSSSVEQKGQSETGKGCSEATSTQLIVGTLKEPIQMHVAAHRQWPTGFAIQGQKSDTVGTASRQSNLEAPRAERNRQLGLEFLIGAIPCT